MAKEKGSLKTLEGTDTLLFHNLSGVIFQSELREETLADGSTELQFQFVDDNGNKSWERYEPQEFSKIDLEATIGNSNTTVRSAIEHGNSGALLDAISEQIYGTKLSDIYNYKTKDGERIADSDKYLSLKKELSAIDSKINREFDVKNKNSNPKFINVYIGEIVNAISKPEYNVAKDIFIWNEIENKASTLQDAKDTYDKEALPTEVTREYARVLADVSNNAQGVETTLASLDNEKHYVGKSYNMFNMKFDYGFALARGIAKIFGQFAGRTEFFKKRGMDTEWFNKRFKVFRADNIGHLIKQDAAALKDFKKNLYENKGKIEAVRNAIEIRNEQYKSDFSKFEKNMKDLNSNILAEKNSIEQIKNNLEKETNPKKIEKLNKNLEKHSEKLKNYEKEVKDTSAKIENTKNNLDKDIKRDLKVILGIKEKDSAEKDKDKTDKKDESKNTEKENKDIDKKEENNKEDNKQEKKIENNNESKNEKVPEKNDNKNEKAPDNKERNNDKIDNKINDLENKSKDLNSKIAGERNTLDQLNKNLDKYTARGDFKKIDDTKKDIEKHLDILKGLESEAKGLAKEGNDLLNVENKNDNVESKNNSPDKMSNDSLEKSSLNKTDLGRIETKGLSLSSENLDKINNINKYLANMEKNIDAANEMLEKNEDNIENENKDLENGSENVENNNDNLENNDTDITEKPDNNENDENNKNFDVEDKNAESNNIDDAYFDINPDDLYSLPNLDDGIDPDILKELEKEPIGLNNTELPNDNDKIKELENKLKDLENKNNDLENKVKDLESKNDDLEKENKELENKNNDLENKNNVLENKNNELENLNKELKENVDNNLEKNDKSIENSSNDKNSIGFEQFGFRLEGPANGKNMSDLGKVMNMAHRLESVNSPCLIESGASNKSFKVSEIKNDTDNSLTTLKVENNKATGKFDIISCDSSDNKIELGGNLIDNRISTDNFKNGLEGLLINRIEKHGIVAFVDKAGNRTEVKDMSAEQKQIMNENIQELIGDNYEIYETINDDGAEIMNVHEIENDNQDKDTIENNSENTGEKDLNDDSHEDAMDLNDMSQDSLNDNIDDYDRDYGE